MAECKDYRDCGKKLKGYPIATGYMGYVPWYNTYMLFSTEEEYYDYVEGDSNESNNKDIR